MVLKLIKHEFKFLMRYLIWIWVGILGVLTLQRIVAEMIGHSNDILHMAGVLVIPMMLLTLAGMYFVTYGVVILRFYQTMFGGEGYLTFTLPVKTGQIIFSKLFAGFVLIMIPLLVMLGLFFSFSSRFEFLFVIEEMRKAYQQLDIAPWLTIVSLLSIPIGTLAGLLDFYLAMSLGQLANRNKLIFSIIFYGGIYFIKQIIGSIFYFTNVWQMASGGGVAEANMILVNYVPAATLIAIIYIIVEWALVYYLCKNKLNLD